MNIIQAIIDNRPDLVEKALQNDISPDFIEDQAEITPLHFCAAYGG